MIFQVPNARIRLVFRQLSQLLLNESFDALFELGILYDDFII